MYRPTRQHVGSKFIGNLSLNAVNMTSLQGVCRSERRTILVLSSLYTATWQYRTDRKYRATTSRTSNDFKPAGVVHELLNNATVLLWVVQLIEFPLSFSLRWEQNYVDVNSRLLPAPSHHLSLSYRIDLESAINSSKTRTSNPFPASSEARTSA